MLYCSTHSFTPTNWCDHGARITKNPCEKFSIKGLRVRLALCRQNLSSLKNGRNCAQEISQHLVRHFLNRFELDCGLSELLERDQRINTITHRKRNGVCRIHKRSFGPSGFNHIPKCLGG